LLATLSCAAALLQPAAAQTTPAATVANALSPEYRLGGGDVVRISVYQNPDLTLEVRVAESGTVSYPLIGALQLGGRTVSEAEALVVDGLRRGGFIKQPQVSVLVLQVRGNQANVLGQVTRPGRYPLEVAGLRLTDLLASAGGATAEGSDVVVVTGQRNGEPFRIEVDLPTIFSSANPTGNLLVQDGDNIVVNRAPRAYIYGEVQRPGAMPIGRGMTLLQGLATGGGLTARGTERGIRLHRIGEGGRVEILSPKPNELLRDGDVVYVRESLF
jgi:polysaccharide export outer membrane protein